MITRFWRVRIIERERVQFEYIFQLESGLRSIHAGTVNDFLGVKIRKRVTAEINVFVRISTCIILLWFIIRKCVCIRVHISEIASVSAVHFDLITRKYGCEMHITFYFILALHVQNINPKPPESEGFDHAKSHYFFPPAVNEIRLAENPEKKNNNSDAKPFISCYTTLAVGLGNRPTETFFYQLYTSIV